ncbi:MAG: hypothetical protein M1470_00670 [Bacteroidetes bacterium]|nr:hypothetical protein [Bacteroidota bacterium]MCL5737022.1 hypothetical protein [Bacteroidota bacterium]
MNEISVFHLARVKLPMEKNRLLLLLVGVNFIFTGLDVALAHAVNNFVPSYELIPIIYAPLGALSSFLVALNSKPNRYIVLTHIFLMVLGVVVGVLGTAFHANEALNPLGQLTWIWLTFASPILAPLAFAGISLVGLYGVVEEVKGQPGLLEVPGLGTFKAPISRDRHFLWLVGLGFAASALTSIIDHGQYGYSLYKLIPIVYGLFAIGVVISLAVSKNWSSGDELTYFWTMIAAIVVGMLGFAFHLSGDLADNGQLSLERILVFAPILAPLLYADLGVLGLIVVANEEKK